MGKGFINSSENYYKKSYILGTIIRIPNTNEFTKLNGSYATMGYLNASITITKPDSTKTYINYEEEEVGEQFFTFEQDGTYTINYQGTTYGETPLQPTIYENYSFTYIVSAIENHLPLKKWTITDVINRLLDIAEPLRGGERPRFRLNGMRADGTIITEENKKEGETVGQAAAFEKILSPELAFTKQTLRECLQQIGGVIHGEPRLTPKSDGEGWYYEVRYDMYAGDESSDIQYVPYTDMGNQLVIESYLGHLDTTAENLVNQLDKFSGVIVEPYEGGARSVRTENMYVRIEEGNMLIATQYPIYTVEKLEYVYADGGALKSVDITPYVFEKSVYDGTLSSFEGVYPYSKMYAIYFSQGNKNIEGLNFKVPATSAASEIYKYYAIVNILREVLGNPTYQPDYPKMCFRVTYTPFYTARIAQTKVNYKDSPRPAALIYNQTANVIESRAYGENLKGAVARLGNLESSLTYHLWTLNEVPRAGQKYNDKFYISAVATEILPNMVISTIGLSKDFNRLSQYIGISSVKRYYEVSKNQAVERNTLYREYIVVGESEEVPLGESTTMGRVMLSMIASMFSPQEQAYGPVTNVLAWGSTYNGTPLTAVQLPVISSAFGNSISFSWKYEDNYSAGAQSNYQVNQNVNGYFQQSLPYGDFYGRLYYYDFDLQFAGTELTASNFEQVAQSLPKGKIPVPNISSGIANTYGASIIMRKDNREALQVNYQVDFVSNQDGLIIGSALASYCPAIRGMEKALSPRLYVFPTELNKFTDHVESFVNVKLANLPSYPLIATVLNNNQIVIKVSLPNATFPTNGKSWAIVTAQDTITVPVQGEDGTPTEQVEYVGGDLLIGRNMDIKAGQPTPTVYLTKKHEIFDKTVWKART